jgi:hypothetical protein
MKKRHFFIGIFLLACTIQSCDTTKKDWEGAKETNTIKGYNTFLEKHPDSYFAQDAKRLIDSLELENIIMTEWNLLVKNPTVEKLESFILNYPNSIFHEQGLNIIDSISFKEAIKIAKIENSKFDTLGSKNIKSIFEILNIKEKQDLIDILVTKSINISDTSKILNTVKPTIGNDFSKTLGSSGMSQNGTISQESEDGTKYTVKIKSLLMGESLGNSMLIGYGDYLIDNDVQKINLKGSYTVKRNGKYYIISTYYPEDKLYFKVGIGTPHKFNLTNGENTVIRVIGKLDNFFNGVAINSDESFPLHFVIKKEGLLYLMGKGEVKTNYKNFLF